MGNNGKSEKKILELIISEYSWEQVLYKIIAWEGLDPWDLDIARLSDSFMMHISEARELDFRLPAKYVLIASVLLRMKSDHLKTVREEEMDAALEGPGMEETPEGIGMEGTEPPKLVLNAITVPPRRTPRRKIVVTELVSALRRTLATQERRERKLRQRGKIEITEEDIAERIENLYQKIDGIMSRMKAQEVKFSGVVKKWERGEIVDTLLPLIHLDHQRRLNCRQEELFKEIFIKKPEKGSERLESIRLSRQTRGAG